MKKLVLFVSIIFSLSEASVAGLQLPLQQSVSVINGALKVILKDSGFAYHMITKISSSLDGGKVELRSPEGTCVALPFKVSYDAQGTPQVGLDTAAIAQCDATNSANTELDGSFAKPKTIQVSAKTPLLVTCGNKSSVGVMAVRVLDGMLFSIESFTSGKEEVLKLISDKSETCTVEPNRILKIN